MRNTVPSSFTPEVLNSLEVHCKAGHPLDPAEGLRFINEVRLLQWQLEYNSNPMHHAVEASAPVSSQFDDFQARSYLDDH